MLQVTPRPRDTNGNGFPDLIEIRGYLFSSGPHPMPFYEDGAFVFELFLAGQSDVADAEPINAWRIAGSELDAAKAGADWVGPCYVFRVSMLEGETPADEYPLLNADLKVRFEPADGRPAVVRRDVHRLQIGSTTASR